MRCTAVPWSDCSFQAESVAHAPSRASPEGWEIQLNVISDREKINETWKYENHWLNVHQSKRSARWNPLNRISTAQSEEASRLLQRWKKPNYRSSVILLAYEPKWTTRKAPRQPFAKSNRKKFPFLPLHPQYQRFRILQGSLALSPSTLSNTTHKLNEVTRSAPYPGTWYTLHTSSKSFRLSVQFPLVIVEL